MRIKQYIYPLLLCLNMSYANADYPWFPSPWTAVGSTGVVDESDIDEVEFNKPYAMIKSNPSFKGISTVTLRYNVTAIPDLANGGVAKSLTVRFQDNGENSRVLVYLRRYNIEDGSSADVLSMDSDSYPSSSSLQTITVNDGCTGERFDFNKYAYYVEVTLLRTTPGLPKTGIPSIGQPTISLPAGAPIIAALKIEDVDIC